MPVLRRDNPGGLGIDRGLVSRASIIVMGAGGVTGQVLILRELVSATHGGELAIGVILANWLLLEGLGSLLGAGITRNRSTGPGPAVLLQTIFALSLPLSLLFARTAGGMLGVPPGSAMGLSTLVPASLITLLPVAFSHGMLFPVWCGLAAGDPAGKPLTPGRVYVFEVLGTTGGGIALSLLLIPLVPPERGVLLISLLNILISIPLVSRRSPLRALYLLLGFIALILCLPGISERLGEPSLRRSRPGLVAHRNTVHGALSVTEEQGQYTFYRDGQPFITTPGGDVQQAEILAHFAMLAHPAPERVLIVGAGPGGLLREVLKHGPGAVVWAELDPGLPELLRLFPTPETAGELDHPAVSVVHTDGRRYIEESDIPFDVVILGTDMPGDLQTNRLYTVEFFTTLRERLGSDGVLAFTMPGSPSGLTLELSLLNALIEATTAEVFARYDPVPGDVNLFLAFRNQEARSDAALFSERLEERGVRTVLLSPPILEYLLHERHLVRYRQSVAGLEPGLNTDHGPLGVFLSVAHWNRVLSPGTGGVFRFFQDVSFRKIALLLLLAAIAVPGILFLLSRRRPGAPVTVAVFTGGFSGMMMELALVYSFQTLFGHLYLWLGVLFACFMAGAALGALTGENPRGSDLSRIAVLLCLIIVFSLTLPLALNGVETVKGTLGRGPGTILFLILPVAAGFLTGGIFPSAARLHGSEGTVYSADLMGGWVGGTLSGVFLLPLLGLGRALMVPAILSFMGLAGLWSLRRSTSGGHS